MYKVYIVNKKDKEDKKEIGERKSYRGAMKLWKVIEGRINENYEIEIAEN